MWLHLLIYSRKVRFCSAGVLRHLKGTSRKGASSQASVWWKHFRENYAKNMSFVTAVICQAKKVCMKLPAMVFKSGSGVPKRLGGGAPKRLGSGVPKRLGGGAPKRLGSRVPKRLGGSAPKRFVSEPYQVSKGIQKNVSTPSHCLYCRRKAYAYPCWDGSNGARPTIRFPAQPPWRFGAPFPTSRTVAGCFIAQQTGKTRKVGTHTSTATNAKYVRRFTKRKFKVSAAATQNSRKRLPHTMGSRHYSQAKS